jgi:hypothetical protein
MPFLSLFLFLLGREKACAVSMVGRQSRKWKLVASAVKHPHWPETNLYWFPDYHSTYLEGEKRIRRGLGGGLCALACCGWAPLAASMTLHSFLLSYCWPKNNSGRSQPAKCRKKLTAWVKNRK